MDYRRFVEGKLVAETPAPVADAAASAAKYLSLFGSSSMHGKRVHSPGALARSVRLFPVLPWGWVHRDLGCLQLVEAKPAPLESFEPHRTVSVVWSQGPRTVEGAAGLTFVSDSVIAASAGGDVVAQPAKWFSPVGVGCPLPPVDPQPGAMVLHRVVTSNNELVVFERSKEIWREQ